MNINKVISSLLLAALLFLSITGCQDRGGRESAPSVPPAPGPAEEAPPGAAVPEAPLQMQTVAIPTPTTETSAGQEDGQEEGQPIGLPMVEGVEGEQAEASPPGGEQ